MLPLALASAALALSAMGAPWHGEVDGKQTLTKFIGDSPINCYMVYGLVIIWCSKCVYIYATKSLAPGTGFNS